MNIEQTVKALLIKHPPCRQSYNALCLGYWIAVDAWPMKQKDFRKTTPLESIVRGAREVWKSHPELSPTAYTDDMKAREKVFDLFTSVFPGATDESG